MLEKLNTAQFMTVSTPCADAIACLNHVLQSKPEPVIAEIGVGVGATTLEMCTTLKGRGHIHIFDYEASVDELAADLGNLGHFNLTKYGNSRKVLDSYSWSLARLAMSRREDGGNPTFDFAFLDGAHNFIHDAPSSLLVAEMLAPGGFILFDDLNWKYDATQTMNPKTNPTVRSWFTEEQTSTAQVNMVCQIFFEGSERFVRRMNIDGHVISDRRALYQKL